MTDHNQPLTEQSEGGDGALPLTMESLENELRALWRAVGGNPGPTWWWFDEDHRPYRTDDYSVFDRPERVIEQTHFGPNSMVSTVFLCIDHNFWGGPPVLWETMVFGIEKWDDYQERYTTYEDAVAGHRSIVDRIRIERGLALDAGAVHDH